MLRARSAAAAWRGFPANSCCPGIQASIIAEDPRFFDALRRDHAWRELSAVRARKVYLEPSDPFGWLNDPPGVNRLIGLYSLSTLFYDFPVYEDLRGIACEFYDKFIA